MEIAEQVLNSLAEMDRYVCLMAGAQRAADVVAAVRDYLAAWPAVRVSRMQRVDAGWAPFDEDQKPAAVYHPADVQRFCNAVHCQCVDLRGAGMAPAPELLELDLFLFLASMKLAELEPESATVVRTPQPPAHAADLSRSSVHRRSARLA
jgi:hypothetical protein